MKRVMIDFETFGNGKNACIVEAGACYFGEGEVRQCIRMIVDAEDAQRHGAEIDASTVYWWLKQSDRAREAMSDPEGRMLEFTALEALNKFLAGADEIWSHATFDFVILMEALKRRNIKPAFSYRVARDIRTLHALSGLGKIDKPRFGTHHDALDDAIYQAQYVMEMLTALRVT